jgi:hypothetical protein
VGVMRKRMNMMKMEERKRMEVKRKRLGRVKKRTMMMRKRMTMMKMKMMMMRKRKKYSNLLQKNKIKNE